MTNQAPKKNRHSILLKVIALVIGYSFWYIFGGSHASVVTFSVPVCFYNMPANTHIVDAPESISITLAGKRADIRALNQEHLAVHLDASRLRNGKQPIPITEQELMLPTTGIKLVQHSPSNPTVELSVHKTS